MAGPKASKPAYRYLRLCNHADHPRGQCRQRAMVGMMPPEMDAMMFKKLPVRARQRKV